MPFRAKHANYKRQIKELKKQIDDLKHLYEHLAEDVTELEASNHGLHSCCKHLVEAVDQIIQEKEAESYWP
jgi:archaellum component FlaC